MIESLGLESSWLKSPGLKGLGLKSPVLKCPSTDRSTAHDFMVDLKQFAFRYFESDCQFQKFNSKNIQISFISFSGISCPLSCTVFAAHAALLQQSQGIRAAWDSSSCLK
jgi:hypothetical protein